MQIVIIGFGSVGFQAAETISGGHGSEDKDHAKASSSFLKPKQTISIKSSISLKKARWTE